MKKSDMQKNRTIFISILINNKGSEWVGITTPL